MLTPSHMLIGHAISKTLKSNINWNYPAFQYGCVIPDLLYPNPHHNYQEAQAFINSLIKGLIYPQPGLNYPHNNFFFTLGIVCHYISDCFCRAHNDSGYISLYPHLRYEYQLWSEFNRYNLTGLCSAGLASCKSNRANSPEHIEGFIKLQYNAYLSEKERMSKDINYAVQTATAVIASIIFYGSYYDMLLSETA